MAFFSIIIPTYNRGYLLAETLKPVLQQTFTDYEVLVVDDGSTDHTAMVMQGVCEADNRVRYLPKINEERGAARNYGLKQAAGQFAVFFDSDDIMHTDYLQQLHEIIRSQPGIRFLAMKYDFQYPDGTHRASSISKLPEGWYGMDFFLKGNVVAANCCIRINDKAYKEFPPQRELASMEDWLFVLLNTQHHKLFIKDAIGLSMRQHDDRSMGDNQKVIRARQSAVNWVETNLSLPGNQLQTLKAWSHYFCGIHQYLDHRRGAAVKEALQAIRKGGVQNKFLILLVKALVGRKLIRRFS